MADIVERLRGLADLFEAGDAPRHLVLHMRAGADEIERLRAGGCARDQGTTQYCAEAAKKDAEIASLLNLLADARTESMKLRAALREIESLDDEPKCCGRGIGDYLSPPECCGDPERGIDRAQSIARAALEGK